MAITIEGVVAVLWLMNRVGTVSEICTEQVFGYFTSTCGARLAQLECGRRIDAMQIGIIEGVDQGWVCSNSVTPPIQPSVTGYAGRCRAWFIFASLNWGMGFWNTRLAGKILRSQRGKVVPSQPYGTCQCIRPP